MTLKEKIIELDRNYAEDLISDQDIRVLYLGLDLNNYTELVFFRNRVRGLFISKLKEIEKE